MPKGSGTALVVATYQDAPILFFPQEKLQSLSTGVFGTVITACISNGQPAIPNSGDQN
jgi:hypothetical protein